MFIKDPQGPRLLETHEVKNQTSYQFYFFYFLHSIWDLSSPTSDQTHIPCIGIADS